MVHLELDPKRTGADENFSLAGWDIMETAIQSGEKKLSIEQNGVQAVIPISSFSFHIRRNINYYLWKVALPITVISSMSWAVFWISRRELGPTLAVSSTAILTLIAFMFSLRHVQPPVSMKRPTPLNTLRAFNAMDATHTGNINPANRSKHMRPIKGIPNLLTTLTCLCLMAASSLATAGDEAFEFDSWKDLETYFEEIGYTETEWDQGMREVPRLFITNLPSRWRNTHSKEVEVRTKKEVFFRVMAPLILKSNEDILAEREKLVVLAKEANPDAEQARWLHALALRYRVIKAEHEATVSPAHVEELLLRVDAIPPSLTMAQSAEESGWGTSRFADVGNAMFGQWAWGDKAIKPQQQRQGKGNYGIASFDTPQASVSGYMLNINTHRAYSELRARRAQLREAGKAVSGMDLSPTLLHYSERGEHYVKSLNTIMRVNKLLEIDEAYLGNDPIVWLVPTGAGAE